MGTIRRCFRAESRNVGLSNAVSMRALNVGNDGTSSRIHSGINDQYAAVNHNAPRLSGVSTRMGVFGATFHDAGGTEDDTRAFQSSATLSAS